MKQGGIMKNSVALGFCVFLLSTLVWISANIYYKEFSISGRDIYNAKRVCDQNQGIEHIKLFSDKREIVCHNGASFIKTKKKPKEED
jgi:hypothetical protein